jgi:hypothetical protein
MHLNKKLSVILFLTTAVLLGIAGSMPPQDQPKRNLKVLPKNISKEELEGIMDGFKAALGVKCNFCHTGGEVDGRFRMDFASDAKPEKETARKMLRMVSKINKKFFHYKAGADKEALPPIGCKTCHNGKPNPNKP